MIKPYSIIGWGLSRKSMALAGELKHQFMKALKLEAFRWLQALQFNRKFLLEERSQKWFFRHCHNMHIVINNVFLMRWMDFLYQSLYICVDIYYFIIITVWGSASVTSCIIVNPKKPCSQNKDIFYFLSNICQWSNNFKSLRIICSNLSADDSARPSFNFGAIQELEKKMLAIFSPNY